MGIFIFNISIVFIGVDYVKVVDIIVKNVNDIKGVLVKLNFDYFGVVKGKNFIIV